MMTDRRGFLGSILGATAVRAGIGWRSCSRQGGHYVRGVVGMECVR